MKEIIPFIFVFISLGTSAQRQTDSIKTKTLKEVTLEANRFQQDITRLAEVQGMFIFSGKKNEVIDVTQKNFAVSEKYARQLFAKVPGVFVYDMDGTGNQLNISTRGLDAHRGWEFNTRKDGIITNSDMYGYPASHYNIPMEAVERIEIVRGTGSLQYGAQFGGMLNYISKKPDTTKQLSFENINSVGSYGLVSTYNRASGKIGKVRYSGWFNKKWITGYRKNSDSQYDAEAFTLYYDPTSTISLKFEWTHSNYIAHIPGPLTDAMFKNDPQMATRSRNYYSPDIHVPSFTFNWKINPNTKLQLSSSAVLGTRNSVLFDKPATVTDTIVLATRQYTNRQVDIDHFNSYTSELSVLRSYHLFNKHNSTLAAGFQYMNNSLHRQQLGKGTTGTDFDLTLVTPSWGRDLHYKTTNIALFAENKWMLTKRLAVNTGIRVEVGETNLTGVTSYYNANELPNTIKHKFPLIGVSAQYNVSPNINVYGGWSQAYRPVIFKDIIPASIYEVSDKNLKDAFGYNAEIGFRGNWKNLKWDITAFQLQYNNRLGTLAQTDATNNLLIYKTNIGDSKTTGVEAFIQGDFSLSHRATLTVFSSTSYMDARYQNASLKSGNENVNITGNKVESVPKWISRNGATLKYSLVSFSLLYSYTAQSFADAFNTVQPNSTGSIGIVPSYQLLDINTTLQISATIKVQVNINNAFDVHYFTKRPQFYPGPGIWPSDGRTLSTTVSIRI